jgi:hypothetical protein
VDLGLPDSDHSNTAITDCEVVALVYLNIMIAVQLNIFAARTRHFFFVTSAKLDCAPPPALILVTPGEWINQCT